MDRDLEIVNKVVQKNNEMINDVCEKYRLYLKLVTYPLGKSTVYTWAPDIWKWIYHYLEVNTKSDPSDDITFNVRILEDMFNGKEYFNMGFMERLRDKIERSKENG